jgi:hypothetical protein
MRLSEISLITKDAFEPDLPLSVVVHIDDKKARRVYRGRRTDRNPR